MACDQHRYVLLVLQVQQACAENVSRKAAAAAIASAISAPHDGREALSADAITAMATEAAACAERAVAFTTALALSGYQSATGSGSSSSSCMTGAAAGAAAAAAPVQGATACLSWLQPAAAGAPAAVARAVGSPTAVAAVGSSPPLGAGVSGSWQQLVHALSTAGYSNCNGCSITDVAPPAGVAKASAAAAAAADLNQGQIPAVNCSWQQAVVPLLSDSSGKDASGAAGAVNSSSAAGDALQAVLAALQHLPTRC
jgi:hypothetical protein